MWKHIRAGLAVAALMSGAVAFAQSTNSGDITGTVTDTTGAVIPGVTVTVKDVDKQVMHTYMTNGAGVYDTNSIVPDHYLVTFTKDGFQTYVRGPITVTVGTTQLNAKLNVGSSAQKVVVTTNVPLLDTADGAASDTLEAKTMAKLPQTGQPPDWQAFIWLQPGAAGAPENASTANAPGAGAISINGNLPFETVLQDGATTTLPMSQNSDVTIFETTAEVKVSATAFSAQYGVGNVIYNQITKGGGSRFHGVGYEYFQNNALNAYPYEFGAQNVTQPPLHYNNFGVSVSGPIIPHKVFFYFDYDKTINKGGSVNFTTVPTDAVRNGDFTAAGLPTLYDPTTQMVMTSGNCTYTGSQYKNGVLTIPAPCVQRKSFISEYGSNKIPAQMIDPVAQAIEKYYPEPNQPGNVSSGVPQNNYAYVSPTNNPFTKYFGRLDWDISPKNRLTISETDGDNPQIGFSPVCPINCGSEDVSRDNAQISDVWTVNDHLINEARFGFTDQLNFFIPDTYGKGFPAKLGLTQAVADTFPNVSTSPYYGLGSATNAVYKEFVFDPSDVVTMVLGRHVLHFGGEFLVERADSTAWGNINAGNLSFNGYYTAEGGQATQSENGAAYADFLLGQENSWSSLNTPEYGARQKLPQMFIQDDWKVRPNLTLNLGLRWQGNTGWSEVHGNETVFDPNVINPANNQAGAMWYGFSKANGRTQLIAPKYNTFLPRFGFSWQPVENTVLRGGFGVYASTWSEDTYGAGMGSAFGKSGGYSDNTSGICPVVQLNANGQSPDTTDPGCGVMANGMSYNDKSILSTYLSSPTTPDARNGQPVSYNMYHTPVPLNYQWQLQLQRQIGLNYAASLAYVGNHGENLPFPVDINQVPESKLAPNDYPNGQPYPLYQQITGSTNNAVSNYNALQAELRKRMTDGFEFDVNYTWSHFLDDQDSSGWGSRGGYQNYQNAFDPSANYSNSNFDIRNMFKGQAIYQLPFGRGRAFLNKSALLDEVVGGWQTSFTFVVQSGNPISITTGGNNSSYNQSGAYTQFANLVGNYHLQGSTKSRLKEWYNLNAFAVPANATYGNFRRNIVTGPGLSELNASLGKTFDLWPSRNVKFELRCDATNVLNHASFGQPGNNAIGKNQSAQITGTTVGGRQVELYGRISF
uniref:TonB-dependent receptor n=1 Tax=Acidobacterium capsulatum TaxID=33075 RepID=A0A7V4XS71_9BACT